MTTATRPVAAFLALAVFAAIALVIFRHAGWFPAGVAWVYGAGHTFKALSGR